MKSTVGVQCIPYFGRKSKLTDIQIVELKQKRADGVLIKHLMQEYDLSNASVYWLLGSKA